MKFRNELYALAAAGLFSLAGVFPCQAGFIDGQIAVLRVGSATSPVAFDSTYLAQSVSLDIYDARTGNFVGTHPMPTSASTAAVLSSRSDDHDGHLNLSGDGQYLTYGGYRATPGSAYPAAQSAVNVPRVIARIASNWAADTSTTLTGNYNGGGTTAAAVTITSVVSTNGQQFWTGGGNETTGTGGLRYVPSLGASSSVNVSKTQSGSAADSMRNVRLIDGGVYINTASQGAYTNRGSFKMTIAGGLPTATVATASTATGVITNKEGSTTDFSGNPDPDGKGKLHPKSDAIYLDLNHDGVRETAYSTGGKEELEKWNLTGTTWTRTDVTYLLSGAEINALDYDSESGATGVFISTDAGIYKLLDTGSIGAGIVSSSVAASDFENKRYFTDPYFIAAGFGVGGDSTTMQFRGLAVVPEPGSMGLLTLSGLLCLRRRRATRGR